jgi:septum formation protein
MTTQIILASASPRRQELLKQIGVKYRPYAVDIDETPRPGELPLDYVQRMAAEKSAAAVERLGNRIPILTADTIVVLGNTIMGKPKGKDDAIAMLRQLSGRCHQVYTAVFLRGGNQQNSLYSVTDVHFKALTEPEMDRYWQSGEPWGKAGSYAIQGIGALFINAIQGSFSGVVGLPLFETGQLLSQQGIKTSLHE